jgi:SET and MYND domain-containing protein 4
LTPTFFSQTKNNDNRILLHDQQNHVFFCISKHFFLYLKGWYRRGKANESLQKYKNAICDLEVALGTEATTSGKRNIKQELEILRVRVDSLNTVEPSEDDIEVKDAIACDFPIACVTSITKGRGMASPNDIQSASLIHTENPLAAVTSLIVL